MAPMIMWFGPLGMIAFSSAGVEVGDVVAMGNTYSRSLKFTSLSPDNEGMYLCMNTATNPMFVQHTVFIASEWGRGVAHRVSTELLLSSRSKYSHHDSWLTWPAIYSSVLGVSATEPLSHGANSAGGPRRQGASY